MPNMFVASDLGDPKLKQIGLRVANSVLLAAEKVVAHDVDAAKYRLPAEPGSMEQILHSRFKSLRESKQKMAAIRVMSFVKAPPQARAAKYQDLVNVDLENDRSVANQVRDLAFPATLKLPGGSSYVSSMAFHGHILPVAALSPLLPFPFPSPFPFPGIPPRGTTVTSVATRGRFETRVADSHCAVRR